MSWQTGDVNDPLTPGPTLRDRFLQLDASGSPSLVELLDLQKAIDDECLRRSQDIGPVTQRHNESSDTVLRLAVYLSKSLLQCGDPTSGIFRETQLRALVATLALLHHSEVTTLNSGPYDTLRRNMSARFSEIVDARKESQQTFAGRLSRATTLYLIRLASQYFSLFKRSQPLADALPIPILGLIFAGVSIAGGQYNSLRAVFRYADDLINLIPGRKSQHLSLPGVQELIRNAITTGKRKLAQTSGGEDQSGDVVAVDESEKAVFEVTKFLQELLTTHIASTPSASNAYWQDWPMARLRRGPPPLDKWHFFFGLLDCAVQLARYLPPSQIPERLQSVLAQLMLDTGFEGFRGKTIEFFLACDDTRAQQYDCLVQSTQTCDEPTRTKLFSEMEGVRDDLERRNPQESASRIEPLSPTSSRVFAELSGRNVSSSSASVVVNSPDSSLGYLEGDLRRWQMHGDPKIVQLPLRRGLRRRSFSLAGLSRDCSSIFFCHSTEICVYSVRSQDRGLLDGVLILQETFQKAFSIRKIALSKHFTLISNLRESILLGLWNGQWNSQRRNEVLLRWPHEAWDPTGVSIDEDDFRLTILVGQRRESASDRFEGRILLFEIDLTKGLPLQKEKPREYVVPGSDFPKIMFLDVKASKLACVTGIRNTVLVWALDEGRSAVQIPFAITKNRYKPETDSDGVTSVSLYTAPSGHPYILCTTAASTERWRNGGEWPFCSLVVTPPGSVPASSIHNLEQLKNQRALVAGTVSSQASIFAVLERTGKIFLVGLTGHGDGGICGEAEAPERLSVSLPEQSGVTTQGTSCLRFDPTGSKLYAVDPKGKIVIVSFKPEEGAPNQMDVTRGPVEMDLAQGPVEMDVIRMPAEMS